VPEISERVGPTSWQGSSLSPCGRQIVLCFIESIAKRVVEPIYLDLMFDPNAPHAGGAEFSRFLPLATDEAELQGVGGPWV
jgi:hypothetical protein